jgi:hypothetical protein
MIGLVVKRLIIGVTVSSSVLLITTPSFADTKYTSKDGNLIVQYGKKCSTTKPSGFYRVRNGATGNLTDLTCSTGGDIAEHKFVDVSGKERCYGQMRQIWSRRVFTVWKIGSAIS